jgi:hypothetical protein
MKTLGIIILILVILLFSGLAFILTRKPKPEPEPIDPSIPGVHYYGECDYKGEHKHTDEAPSEVDASFKSVRVTDDFAVKALSTTDEEVFIKGPSTVKCTEFKSMEVLPN